MTYHKRVSLLVFIDSIIVLSAIFFSRFLLEADIHVLTVPLVISSLTLLISHHFFSFIYKLYNKAWEYASVGELIIIFKAITFSIIVTGVMQQIIEMEVHFRLLAVTWMIHMLLIGGSRFLWRMLRDTYISKPITKNRTIIIGAGSAGTMVARQLLKSADTDLCPVAFIDDNAAKHKLDILGIPVVGNVKSIEQKVRELQAENIIIAIPSLSKKGLRNIFNECLKTSAKTQIIPMLEDLISGKVSVNQIREVRVEDLLGRKPVELDLKSISENVTGKTVLVTGAGGSIGSEICRQIIPFQPEKLILLGHGENSIYSIEMELKGEADENGFQIVTEIADLQDEKKMFEIMDFHKPNIVYHAAAHKHVPLMERNPEEAVKNNVIGTRNAASAARWANVDTFVMVSTDKAVNPTSVMGATKKLAEMLVQHFDTISKTKFVAVRFGNVLGSRGSVIPLFKKQIEKGGPVTITHPDMVRYFMTIPEASRLVLQAGALAEGGEIFVLDMGEPVKIIDLAKNLIKMSGHTLDDIDIEVTGMRPGEKLFEELLKEDEVHDKQVYPKIYVGKTATLYIEEIHDIISSFSEMKKDELRMRLLDLANQRVKTEKLLSISS
ncbi:nucleoside-diphosphate sugar epimerase/dehydratase [Metabacillus indicus]|uniref:nucleoside-diphosphate sugar epimerase/dehydratase n=1 Tax=Metabacillus indicus TaxID=246786 RepID=UPI0004938FE0|nr:nucleoside-diphosphate sugar epimerase/dehydratase [Metabacillus indicus]KEZ50338.1 polysaccharide biosynthesis protein EpsC [Metabacillus indicus LMG 22858]